MHGIKICKCKKGNIVNRKGKNRQSLLLHEKKTPNEYPRKIRNISNISKMKTQVTREINLKVFKYISNNNNNNSNNTNTTTTNKNNNKPRFPAQKT